MIGTKFYKPVKTEEECAAYNVAVDWCNSTQKGIIEDKGDYYEVIAVPAPSLEEVKAQKISELKGIRDTKEVEPVQTDKGLFDYDDKSRDRLAIARQALTDNEGMESILWTTADNQRVPLTVEDFAEINSMAAYRSNSLHIKYNELKIKVNEAQTTEEVEAVVWE
jgi:hypothetical protein